MSGLAPGHSRKIRHGEEELALSTLPVYTRDIEHHNMKNGLAQIPDQYVELVEVIISRQSSTDTEKLCDSTEK